MDMSQYNDLFLTETREHLGKIAGLVVALESDHTDRTTIDALFRSAHSVKGMAASMGFDAIAALAHKMEDLMDRVRKGLPVDAGLFDLLLAGEAMLSRLLDDVANGGNGVLDIAELSARIAAYPDSAALPPETGEKLNEEDLAAALPAKDESPAQRNVRIKTSMLDSFLGTTGELITVKHRLTMLAKSSRNQDLADAVLTLDKHLRELHDQVMSVRLMPFSLITERFPRMIRDLARKAGKEITFSIKGGEVDLDRSILDILGDPLAHLLRNSVDHGIETPEERTAAGKAAAGRISISVTREKDQVWIRIEDDGRGIDSEKIVAAAINRGFLAKEKAASLGEDEKLLLICHPGFSTAEKITDISGRGVGMDVVKTAIQGVGGTLSILTEKGGGSSFQLRLPLTIAIINVLIVKTGRFTLAIPLTAVSRTMSIRAEEIATIAGRDSFFMDDEPLAIIPLAEIMNIPSGREPGDPVELFITEVNGRRTGISVDQLLGNQVVFVKPLPRPLSVLKGINSATILGSGEIVFILDILAKML